MTNPKVAIIILNWNGKEDTVECLESIKQVTYPNYKILLVDNGSTDISVEHFRERYPEIEIIANEKNLGYAEGNNVGIRKAIENGADYILILNNDIIVDPEFLTNLIYTAKLNKSIGIIGPMCYYYDSPNKIQSAGMKFKFFYTKIIHLGGGEIDHGQYIDSKEVDAINGCTMLIKKEIFYDIGYLDKDFFTYVEEIDFCFRAKKSGYKIYFTPKSKIWHKVRAAKKGKITPELAYYRTRNQLLFIHKNFPLIKSISINLLYAIFIIPNNWLYFTYKSKNYKITLSIFKGLLSYFKYLLSFSS